MSLRLLITLISLLKNQIEAVGSLGRDKGSLSFQTEIKIQNGQITDSKLLSLKGIKKGTQKNFF